MKVVVASHNPVKKRSVQVALGECFKKQVEVIGTHVEPGVSDQPMSEEETWKGATNRVKGASKMDSDAEYFVGIEGGVQVVDNQ